MQKNLAKIANSWLTGPPKFSTIPSLNFGATAAGNSDTFLVFFFPSLGKVSQPKLIEGIFTA